MKLRLPFGSRPAISSLVFAAIVFFVFPVIARWFFKKFDDSISQYTFVLAIVFLGSFLAEAAGEPIRLLNEDVLNGAILMILVTCTISSFTVERASRNIALLENAKPGEPEENTERILISLAYPETVNDMVDLALLWFERVQTISKETGLTLRMYANETTIKILTDTNANNPSPLAIDFNAFDNWDDFLIFSREVKQDDLFIIVSSRKGYLSYIPQIDKLPKYLLKYFVQNSYIILYPEQVEVSANTTFQPVEESKELLDKAGSYVKKTFTNPRQIRL